LSRSHKWPSAVKGRSVEKRGAAGRYLLNILLEGSMDIAVEVSGGQDDELLQLRDALRERDVLAEANILYTPGRIEPGALGAEAFVQFIGDGVVLPLLVHTLYDYLKNRRRTLSGRNLRINLVRIDMPGGVRRVELTAEGPASEVVEVVEELK
jgi:hypothetical protein